MKEDLHIWLRRKYEEVDSMCGILLWLDEPQNFIFDLGSYYLIDISFQCEKGESMYSMVCLLKHFNKADLHPQKDSVYPL